MKHPSPSFRVASPVAKSHALWPKTLILASGLTLLLFPAGVFASDQDPKPSTTQLEMSTPLEREISGDAVHSYSVTLAAGKLAEIIVEQRGVDVAIRIYDLQSKIIQQYDLESRRQGREHAVFVADAAGTYEVRVSPVYRKDPPGHY